MASLLDNPTDRVRKHRRKTVENGGATISVTLKPGDEAKVWHRIVLDQGGPTPALRYLLRQEAGRDARALSNDELVQMLAGRLRAAEKRQGGDDGVVRPGPVSDGKTPKKPR